MGKKTNNKPNEPTLVDLAASLGIPSEVAEEAIDIAMKTGDPEQYIRDFAAQSETMAAADGAEAQGLQAIEQQSVPDIRNVDLTASIAEIPLATHVGGRPVDEDWPIRIGHVEVQLGAGEKHLKDALCRLFYGLQESNARLRGRTPEEPPRPIAGRPDAIKWLLEQISLAE